LRVLGKNDTEATVHLPGDSASISLIASNHASAVLGAWLSCLQRLESFTLEEATEAAGSATLKSSAGSRFSSKH
jgi:hypothetical protein